MKRALDIDYLMNLCWRKFAPTFAINPYYSDGFKSGFLIGIEKLMEYIQKNNDVYAYVPDLEHKVYSFLKDKGVELSEPAKSIIGNYPTKLIEVKAGERSAPIVKLLTMWKLEDEFQKEGIWKKHKDIIHSGFWETTAAREAEDDKRFYTLTCRMPYLDTINIGATLEMEESQITFFCHQIEIRHKIKQYKVSK